MLTSYPTYFNNTVIIWPTKWSLEYETLETVNETEAGTDVLDVRRKGKLTISATYKTSSVWAKKFQQFSQADSIEVKIYDAASNAYKTYNMRLRKFKMALVKGSEAVRYGNGVYNVSFDLIEF